MTIPHLNLMVLKYRVSYCCSLVILILATCFNTLLKADDEAEPAHLNQLARYIPVDTDIILQWEKLPQSRFQFQKNGFQDRLLNWPPFLAWMKTDEFKELETIHLRWKELTGSTFEQTLFGITGDAGCFMIEHDDLQKPQFACIFLTESPDYAKNVLDDWNQLEQATVEITKQDQFSISKRTSPANQILYYSLIDKRLSISESLPLLQKLISLQTDNPQLNSAMDSQTFYQTAARQTSSSSLAQLIINPTWFHARMNQELKIEQQDLAEKIRNKIQNISLLFGSLIIDDGCHLELIINSKSNPAPGKVITKALPAENKILNLMPQESFLIYAQNSTIDNNDMQLISQEIFEILQQKSEFKQLLKIVQGITGGKQFADSLISLGPHIGLGVKLNIDRMIPADLLLAVELPSDKTRQETNEQAKIALDRVSSALMYYLNISWNSLNESEEPSLLLTRQDQQLSSRWIDKLSSWSPGYGISNHWWLISSDVNWINEIHAETRLKSSINDNPFFRQNAKTYFENSSMIIWCDFSRLRTFSTRYKETLINKSGWFGVEKPETVEQRFNQFLATFNITDSIYLSLDETPAVQKFRIGLTSQKSSAK